MKHIAEIYVIIKEVKERIIATMRERGITEVRLIMTPEEFAKANDTTTDEPGFEEDYDDYKCYEAPAVTYFDKHCCGNSYKVIKVELVDKPDDEPRFKLECEGDYDNDTFYDYDVDGMYSVYGAMEEALGINKDNDGSFVIASVDRDNLDAAGFDTSEVTDDDMKDLASRMSSDYHEQLYWLHLPIIAEYMGIPKKETDKEE